MRFQNVELIAEKNSSLFATLPTGEKSGLPFLVNAEFLLNQDRTELLDVAWNSFLLEKIGLYQFLWLRELNRLQHLYKHVLSIFFMEKLKIKNNSKQLQTAFEKGIQDGVESNAWLPSFTSEELLLKFKECILDETGFFSRIS